MAGTHKKQHTIPRSYLSSWIEPVTPPGQTSAIHLISKADRTVRRKSPSKTFTETDRYTIHFKDGTRDLTIEHYLGGIENDFQGFLGAIRKQQTLSFMHRAKLCAFTAAMLGRSKKQGDWMLKQRIDHLEKIREMEHSSGAEPITSRALEEQLRNHHGTLVVQTIEVVTPLLLQMNLTILFTGNTLGFITSDAPAVMYNPRAHTFPPMYRSPGLLQKDIEISLPLTPRYLALFTHKPLASLYMHLPDHVVDEVNRTTLFHCEKEIVSRTGISKDAWFLERDEPLDSWNPASVPEIAVPDDPTAKSLVQLFESTKTFHDDWRQKIFTKNAGL